MNFFNLAALLTLGVILVNGWTDAPNAIVSPVCSKTLSMKKAVVLASICNFSGVMLMSIVNSSVAKNIFEITNIQHNGAICGALLSVILLAVVAWGFGIPTSESHAIIASLMGAGIATGSEISVRVIIYSLIGLILSVAGGFALGYYLYNFSKNKRLDEKNLKRGQIIGAVFMSFMHGAQDGQKFISIYLIALGITGEFEIPIWAALICSAVMGLGTLMGGGRIIKNVGEKMVELDIKQGICADIAGGISLFISTVLGLPVSTTHVKTASIMGCGYVTGNIEKKAASNMLAAWVITFPACFAMGYLFTKIFTVLF